ATPAHGRLPLRLAPRGLPARFYGDARKRSTAGSRALFGGDDRRAAARARLELQAVEAGVLPAEGEQLLVAAFLDDAAVNKDADLVGVKNRRQAMRDDDRRAALHQPVEGNLDLVL